MTGQEIVRKAETLKKVKYWYGAKGQLATTALASMLKNNYPNVWTADYYKKALKDVDGKTYVGDCSYLVCTAYGYPALGSYQLFTKMSKMKYEHSKLKPGMVLYKPGHVAIMGDDGKTRELMGIDHDFTMRDPRYAGFTYILYDKNVRYADAEEMTGWHTDKTGTWYRYKEGKGSDTYYHGTLAEIDGAFYAFDENGYLITDTNRLYISPYKNILIK